MSDELLDHKSAGLTRRSLLTGCVLGAATTLITPTIAKASGFAMPNEGAFDIAFKNAHTGETFSGTYKVGHKYLPGAFEKINSVLRDFRTNDVFPIDPQIIDILYMIHKKSGSSQAFEILSGYRSPKTNAMLNRASTGVAKNSLHMSGQAVDIRIPYFNTRKVKEIAVGLKAGGVGYYNKSNFVHVDTGRVRQW